MIPKIKKALGCKTNRELALLLDVPESTVSRWKKQGFHRSTERVMSLMILKVERIERALLLMIKELEKVDSPE